MENHGIENGNNSIEDMDVAYYASMESSSTSSNIAGRQRSYSHRRQMQGRVIATQLQNTGIFYFDNDDNIIGRGATSTVYNGYYKFSTDKVPVAVKRVPKELVDLDTNELKIWRDINGLSHQQTPLNIVKLINFVEWKEPNSVTYYFVMELGICDLSKKVSDLATLQVDPETKVKMLGYITGVCNGLKWMHGCRVIHRDLKPGNILIYQDSFGNEIAKISDFGLSRKISNDKSGTISRGVGTIDWMAPETLNAWYHPDKYKFSNKVSLDIFSLGLTMFFSMSFGKHPFHYETKHGLNISQNILDITIAPAQLTTNVMQNNIIMWMLAKNEALRPKIDQVLTHPTFWSLKISLKFVVDVARALDKKSDQIVLELRNYIDQLFDYLYHPCHDVNHNGILPTCSPYFNWEVILGNRLFKLFQERQSSSNVKKYNKNSVMSLIELIRDKFVHYQDMKQDLLDEQFCGSNGVFDEEKFANIFFSNFPNLVMFLFIILSKPLKRYPFIASFKKNHFLNNQQHIPVLPELEQAFIDGKSRLD